jgi:hypothetical protein
MRPSSITSKNVLWFIAMVSLVLFFVLGRWYRGKVFEGDVVSYYSYLPAVVIHGDISMNYALGNDFYSDKIWGVVWKDGLGPVQKYTMGLSWLYAPFFLVAHVSALVLGYEAHGYSEPYKFWLQLSAIFYLLLGMAWLRKVLLAYFPDGVTSVTMLVLAFGTNLYYYSFGQATMPHVYLFGMVSGLLLLTIRFHAAPHWWSAIGIGIVCGLLVLVRPSHIIMWGIPLGFGVASGQPVRDRIRFWVRQFPTLLLWVLLQALVLLPQLFYWRHLTGHWIHYSYGDESFFWNDPKVLSVLFSYRNGWLVYTPLMVLGIAGLLFLRREARPLAVVVPGILLLGTYVISCWWCWWYGGSFGQRAFIDYYPLLALGFAAVFTRTQYWLRMKAPKIAGWSLLGLFVALNLFQTFQYGRGILHYDSMTERAYWNAFGRDRRSPTQLQELLAPDYEAAKRGER